MRWSESGVTYEVYSSGKLIQTVYTLEEAKAVAAAYEEMYRVGSVLNPDYKMRPGNIYKITREKIKS